MNIDELIERSHAQAVKSGWWPEGEQRSVADQVNNFHAEISEAWEEYRAGRMGTWYASIPTPLNVAKPEGFWVEIADLCIRLADTMCAMGWQYRARGFDDSFQTDPPFLVKHLHCLVERMQCHYRDEWIDVNKDSRTAEEFASRAIEFAVRGAWKVGVDLLALCELKMQYNATRPQRHGGKLA